MPDVKTRAVNYLLTVLYPVPKKDEKDQFSQLSGEITQELRLEDALHETLGKTGLEYTIFDGTDLDPSVTPRDAIDAYGKEEVISAISAAERFAASLTNVSDLKLRHAINVCVQIAKKAIVSD